MPFYLERIKASDIFILNTGYEGFSHQLLEVMSVETPIITTAVGGNLELVDDGRNGFLVEYNDRKEIKTALKILLDNKNLSKQFTRSAKEKLKNFSLEKMLENLLRELKNNKI